MPNPTRVLIVEDHLDTCLAERTLLATWGYQARYAFTGLHALVAADEFEPNVILLDLGLPGMDGFDVARQVRTTVPHATIITVTARGDQQARQQALQAGIDYILLKPFDPEKLKYLIENGVHVSYKSVG